MTQVIRRLTLIPVRFQQAAQNQTSNAAAQPALQVENWALSTFPSALRAAAALSTSLVPQKRANTHPCTRTRLPPPRQPPTILHITRQRRRRPQQAVQAWIRPPTDPAAPAALALRQLQLVNFGRLNARVVLCQPLPLHLLVVKGALMRLRIPATRRHAYSAPAPLQNRGTLRSYHPGTHTRLARLPPKAHA